jgi:hypothetical protein
MKILLNGPSPKRKGKPKPNVLDKHEDYVTIKNLIMQGKMLPYQQIGLFFGPDDCRMLGLKWPWRTAADRLRRLIRVLRLDGEYRVAKYETDTPGVWFVRVTRQPQETTQKKGGGRKAASRHFPPRSFLRAASAITTATTIRSAWCSREELICVCSRWVLSISSAPSASLILAVAKSSAGNTSCGGASASMMRARIR